MTPKRINELHEDYRKALERLGEALKQDLSSELTIDGTIQRFEFCFELAWKLAKEILSFQGIDAQSPRAVIKEAFENGLIKDGKGWIDMLEDRNKTSHIYDETQAKIIYEKIKASHYPLLKELNKAIVNIK